MRRVLVRVLAVVLVVLAVLGVARVVGERGTTEVTAYFSSATGLYVGDDVRVLGVSVGSVEDVEPDGDRVRVRLAVDAGTPVPVGAKAAIVAPSLVSGRFVQLAPAWMSGPRLRDGAVIDEQRTAVPVSFDEVKRELTDLAEALGPQGGTDRGALDRAIRTLDVNLADGNDRALHDAVVNLRRSADALSDRRSDLFTTIANLNTFTRNLATNDAAVQAFTRRLDSVAGLLAANRTELTGTVRELDRLTVSLDAFLRHHTKRIVTTVDRARVVAGTLAGQADDLATILHIAPHAIAGLYNTVEDQAITGRLALANVDDVASLLCGALFSVGGTAAACQSALRPLLQAAGVDAAPGSAAFQQLGKTAATPQVEVTPPAAEPEKQGLGGLLNDLLGGGS